MNSQTLGRVRSGMVFVLLLLAGGCGEQPEDAAPVVEKVTTVGKVYEYELDNGMNVLVQPDTRSPVVVSQVWYKVGSSYEYSGITGISHMLEHMMFKGTDDLAPGEFSELIAMNGGSENAATSKDYTWYFQTIASDRLELLMRLEAERMRDVVFSEEEFLKERDVVAEERRRRYEDNPQSVTYERFMAGAFVNSPYHHLPIGWMEDIQAYTVEDAKRWYEAWYAPNNATLVVVGDVEPGEVYRLAKKYFGPLQPSEIPELKPRNEIPQLGIRRIEVHALRARVPYLLMGYHVPVLNTTSEPWEVYALEVLAGVLDGGESARLSRNIVRGQQLAVSAGVSYNPYSRLSDVFTFAAMPVGSVSVETLEEALRKEIEKLKSETVSVEELERVKAQVVAADVYERDSMYYQAMQLGILETVGLGWRRLEEYIPGVQAVTAEQVQAVARKYLIDRHLTVAELVPETTPEVTGNGGVQQ